MKKIVLAYSGGLDTSIILKWLQINYKAEVIAYTSNIGQDLNKKKIIQNARRLGVKKIIIEDLKNIFVKDYVFPMIRAHAVYEGVYLLGTSIARPLIAKRQIEIYQWLFRQNGFDVDDMSYFVYCNGIKDSKVFDNCLNFEVKILPYKANDSWVTPALKEIKNCLNSEDLPEESDRCDYCAYNRKIKLFG